MTVDSSAYIHGSSITERRRLASLNSLLNGRSLRVLQLREGDRVLDVGSGQCSMARLMAREVGSRGRVLAIEKDAAQIEEAERLAEVAGETGLIEIRQGDATALPLREDEWGAFDVVHARFLLEHVRCPEAVVASMVKALRPGGRIVLEDDDHDFLRMWPELPEFEGLWDALLQTWEVLGNDPCVGRRLVSLLEDAGARATKNQLLFFGGCAGDADFEAMAGNFALVVETAKEDILANTVVTEEELKGALETFSEWMQRPGVALWYASCWAEGRKLEVVEAEKPEVVEAETWRDSRADRQRLGIPQHRVDSTGQSFESLGLSAATAEALRDIGFERPTPIQERVIPIALEGVDLIGLAQTGSGKTAAFCLPMTERLRQKAGAKGLILCPTREIAMQTKAFLDVFGHSQGLRATEIIGGVKIEPQVRELRRGPDIIVATPGRLLDHIRRGTARVDGITTLVLDEADHMLDLGFLPQIRAVLGALPVQRQTMMFSATMPLPIERLAQRFLHDAVRVDLLPQGAAEGIEHRLYLVEERNKKPCLLSLVAQEKGSVLVFLRRKVDADWACRQLEIEGHPVERIHSGLSQSQRDAALRGFREGEHRVLVATDVAARGIDVPRIEHIINFDPPQTADDYIHRAGRTARGALLGRVSTIATWDAKPLLALIESALGHSIPRSVAPGVEPYIETKARKSGRRRLR